MRLVIVGGGAAGTTAAQFARKGDRTADISIMEATAYPEYSRCGLPYALSGKIPSFESLIEYSEEWFRRNGIDLRLSTSVVGIDPAGRSVTVEGPGGERSVLDYDSVVLATGAAPSVPKIDGLPTDGSLRQGVFRFRDMEDAKTLKQRCSRGGRRVLVVGAGLVGLEVAEALHGLGNDVAVVEFLDSPLPTMMDPDMTEPLSKSMEELGIGMRTGTHVEALLGSPEVAGARLRVRSSGEVEEVECDTVVLATGQRPRSELGRSAGCALGRQGHLIVNDRCETSVKGIYAVGDCSQYVDLVTGRELPVGMGTLAVRMGEVAGRNAAGGDSRLPAGFLNTRVTELFGHEMAAAGPVSSALSDAGIRFVQSRVKGSTLPAYYPGGRELLVKLTASTEDERLLSCQVVGEREAGLRADIIAALILGGKSVRELAMFENAYAPPVAPCVDVLTMAAQGIMIKLERGKRS